jgi:hypothetical protein
MANTLLRGKVQSSTTVERVPSISITEQDGAVLAQAPAVPADASVKGLITRINRRLLIIFDVVTTIALIVLLGDEEDDLRWHPAFIHATQAWRRQQK